MQHDYDFDAIVARMKAQVKPGKVVQSHSEKEFNVFSYAPNIWHYWDGDYEIHGPFKSEEIALQKFYNYVHNFQKTEMLK